MGMGTGAPGELLDFAELSFFDLDRLFSQSARALRRKLQRKRRREKGGASGSSRSRTPPHKRLLTRGGRAAPGSGGFTGSVEKVEKTVVVTNVPPGADEKTVFRHFSKCGTVCDVRIVRNRLGSPTGTVIIEFQEDEAVARACSLPQPHNEILGTVVLTKRADAQIQAKNAAPKRMMTRQQFTQQVLSGLKTGAAESGPHMRKLHIQNLRPVVTEEDMRGIFKPFGEFEEFEMGKSECWITFQSHNDAQDAMSSMQGFQLVGQELKITLQSAPTATPPALAPAPAPAAPPESIDLKTDSDFGATGAGATPLHNRLDLMKKLLSSHSQQGVPTVVGVSAPGGAPAPSSAPSTSLATGTPPAVKEGTAFSRTLLLQNMFSPSAVNLRKDPRFYDEIREDTHDECAKFGKVLHVTVDPRGTTGLIYVLYETPQQRMAAEAALNGRWFEGKKIVAQGIDDSIWQALAAQATSGAA